MMKSNGTVTLRSVGIFLAGLIVFIACMMLIVNPLFELM